jgi:hypothetical protein
VPYAQRNAQGSIIALFAQEEERGPEFIRSDHSDVQAFLYPGSEKVRSNMQASDMEMARVVEDLIQVLIEKDVINIESLPGPTRQKIERRKSAREAISRALEAQLFPGA